MSVSAEHKSGFGRSGWVGVIFGNYGRRWECSHLHPGRESALACARSAKSSSAYGPSTDARGWSR